MTKAFIENNWQHAKELPGIGDYASAAHDVFCRGEVPLEPPNDHALKQYVIWYNEKFRNNEKKTVG
jgi:hypothetical protein